MDKTYQEIQHNIATIVFIVIWITILITGLSGFLVDSGAMKFMDTLAVITSVQYIYRLFKYIK